MRNLLGLHHQSSRAFGLLLLLVSLVGCPQGNLEDFRKADPKTMSYWNNVLNSSGRTPSGQSANVCSKDRGAALVDMRNEIQRRNPGSKIPAPALDQVLGYASSNWGGAVKSDCVVIDDLNRPQNEPRFHIINLHSLKVMSIGAASGEGSDPQCVGKVCKVNGKPNSLTSQSGLYTTEGFHWKDFHGATDVSSPVEPSIVLRGRSPGTASALVRKIRFHGCDYCSATGARAGSHGCPAIAREMFKEVAGCFLTPDIIAAVTQSDPCWKEISSRNSNGRLEGRGAVPAAFLNYYTGPGDLHGSESGGRSSRRKKR